MDKILKLLEENARYTNEEIAVMTQKTPEEVAETIDRLEKEGVIRGYKPIVDRDKISDSRVFAMIELRVTPKRDLGFDEIAEKIAEYPEVEDVYLMSGGYDFTVMIEAKTMRAVAQFVAEKLSTIDSVLSTATHFILKKYKDHGTIMLPKKGSDRMVVTP